MAEEVDFAKIPLEDRVVHKVWKARVHGYEGCVKHFKGISDPKSNEYTNFVSLLKKFVIDSNAVAQEKGLDAVLAFVEYAAPSISGRAAGDVVSGVVTKCLNARPKTKQKGIDICMMYLEIEKQEAVQEEILKGLDNKQPKIVTGCVSLLRLALSEFGGKIFPLKPVVKVLPKLFDHSDKNVREETKLLTIEIYKWIRDAVKAQLTNIKPVQLKELEEEWSKLEPTPPKPTRLTRSQQEKMAQAPEETADEAVDGGDTAAADDAPSVDIDSYELLTAVDVLAKLPKDFYENMAATKWSTRKEALEQLDKLTSNPKLEAGQYGELMTVLKKTVTKDSNVVVVALAGKCITGLANGLRKKFAPYSSVIIPAILEKFKEKKQNVVLSLREAIDAVFTSTNFAAIQEDVVTSIASKNPSVREETVKFLVRAFSKSRPADLPRQTLKPLSTCLTKCMDDTSAPVRDAAAEALGVLFKLLGERVMGPCIDQLDKIKQDKVKEFAEKAEIKAVPGQTAASSKSAPSTSKTTAASSSKGQPATSSGAMATAKKSPSAETSKKAAPSKTAEKKPRGSASTAGGGKGKPSTKKTPGAKKTGGGKAGSATSFKDDEVITEPEMTQEEVDAKAEELIPAAIREQLGSSNWKERLAGTEALTQFVNGLDSKTLPSQVLIRTLAKKPGWKESNFQVLKNKFSLCAVIANFSSSFSKRSAFYAISGLVDKIGDIKLKEQCKETLMVFAENITLNYVSLKVSSHAGEQKNPKVLAESLNWLSEAVGAFGLKIDIKPHVNYIKQSLSHSNPAVRTAAIATLGVLYTYTGASLRMFFESEKPALLQQIDGEFEKVKDVKPAPPTRGVAPKASGTEEGDDSDQGEDGDDGGSSVTNLADLIPRTDVSAQIKPELISELGDKKWQTRGEALQKVAAIIDEAKYITANIGELPGALKARLGDSNKNLVITTLNIIGSAAKAMGQGSLKHIKTLVPATISVLGDNKPQVRAAAISCLNSWHEEIGLGPLVESEVISGTLGTDNPNMRAEMFGWLEEKLPNEKKLPSEINLVIPILFSSLEGRSADVRKKAQGALPALLRHVGWDVMVKQAGKLKPASKTTVMAVLEKHKPEGPVGKKEVTKVTESQEKSSGPAKTEETATKKIKPPGGKAQSAKAVTKKSSGDTEEEGPVLLANPNGRENRTKAEKDLKVLKWNFGTPQNEHIEQLKEQMSSCVSRTLLTNLFHKDFKYQVIALTALTKALTPTDNPPLKDQAIQSTDILLKWCSLRFFDTNTTVLIKCLEFLEVFFTILSNDDVKLNEYEASSFIPYLVQKVGDPKDAVRKMVRGLFRWIIKIYPASKLFNYISDGLKSKNSKTRTECLDELGYLINVYGMTVCSQPGKALAPIAAQIADRDNGVRNAALNAIVEVYNLVGETVYKYLGRVSDKDQSLLEERIRRAGKTKPSTEEVKPVSKKQNEPTSQTAEKKTTKSSMPQNRNVPAPAKSTPQVKQYFSLDLDQIEKESTAPSSPLSQLIANDSIEELMNEPVPVLPRTPGNSSSGSLGRKMFSPNSSTAAVDYCVSQIASSDIKLSITALKELEEHFKNKGSAVWMKHLNQCLIATILQLRMILSTHLHSEACEEEDIINLYKCLLNTLLTLFSESTLARAISREVLKDVIHVLLSTLIDDNLIKLYEGPQVLRCVNKLMISVMDKPDRNSLLGTLMKLLQDGVTYYSTSQKLVELIMKCLWRLTRMLPAVIQDINMDQALLDLHLFFKTHPTSTWKEKNDDKPLRTVKTILHSLIKLKGQQILDHLDLIDDPEHSEVVSYARALLKPSKSPHGKNKNSVQDEKSSRELTSQSPKRRTDSVSQELHDSLGDIFRKIGTKEHTKQGLNDLYEFQQKYKHVDIDPFLKQTSEFFQKYIARGLKTIHEERRSSNSENVGARSPDENKTNAANPAGNSIKTSGDVASYRERLMVLQKKYGMVKTPTKAGAPTNEPSAVILVPPSSEVTNDNLVLPTIPSVSEMETFPEPANQPVQASSDFLDLRKRLEKIKKNAS